MHIASLHLLWQMITLGYVLTIRSLKLSQVYLTFTDCLMLLKISIPSLSQQSFFSPCLSREASVSIEQEGCAINCKGIYPLAFKAIHWSLQTHSAILVGYFFMVWMYWILCYMQTWVHCSSIPGDLPMKFVIVLCQAQINIP